MNHFIQAVSLLIAYELFIYYFLNCKNTHTLTKIEQIQLLLNVNGIETLYLN